MAEQTGNTNAGTSTGATGGNTGAATGDLLTGQANGGGTGNTSGSTGTTGATGQASSTGTTTRTWRDELPEDLRNDPGLEPIKDLAGLAKSYIHAQKAIGAEKIVVPGKHATDEDWANTFKKLGLPEADKYDLPALEGAQPEVMAQIKDVFHKAGVLPKQAEKILGLYSEMGKKAVEAQAAEKQNKIATTLNSLKTEWGQGFDKEINITRNGLQNFASDEEVKYIRESGLGNDPVLIKIFNKVGKSLGEDSMKGGSDGSFGLTPSEISSKINNIMADRKGPYYDKSHPNHANAVKEMEQLFKMQTTAS